MTASAPRAGSLDDGGFASELLRAGTTGEIHFQFESDPRYLEELDRLLHALLHSSGLPERDIRRFTMAVREIGANAIEWGHRKQVDRLVTVIYRLDAEKVVVLIRDTGAGFDPAHLPHAAQAEDPMTHLAIREALGLREGGFGLVLARGLVDDFQVNPTGNEVRLSKYLPRRSADSVSVTGPPTSLSAGA